MNVYANFGGNSNVAGFQLGPDYIVVVFNGGSSYLYNYSSTGTMNVEHMKTLAKQGVGLNSFISRVVRKSYARKLA